MPTTRNRYLYAFAILLVAVPLLAPQYPPLMDLPGHMARYAISTRLDDPVIAQFYAFEWALVGNVGFDVLVYALAPFLDIESATKLVLIATVLANALGLVCLSKAVHGRIQASVLLALPLIYGHSFMLGFVNYVLAIALAVWGLWLWIRLTLSDRYRLRTIVFPLVALIVWAAHAVGWIVLGAACSAWLLSYNLHRLESRGEAIGKTFVACLPLAIPAIVQLLASDGAGGLAMTGFLDLRVMARWAVMLLRDRWFAWDIASAALIYGTLALAAFKIFGLRLDPHLKWAALAVLALFLFGPREMNAGSDFVSSRILTFACIVGLVAIDTRGMTPSRRKLFLALSLAFVTARMAAHTVSFVRYDASMRHQLQALRLVPEGSRIAAFAAMPCRSSLDNWAANRLESVAAMAVVRKNAYIGSLWAVPGLHLLRIRYPLAKEFQTNGSGFVHLEECPVQWVRTLDKATRELPSDAFDFVWLIDVPRQQHPSMPRWRPIWTGKDAILYAVSGPVDRRSPPKNPPRMTPTAVSDSTSGS